MREGDIGRDRQLRPARQRLDRHHLVGDEIDDRLVRRPDLRAVEDRIEDVGLNKSHIP